MDDLRLHRLVVWPEPRINSGTGYPQATAPHHHCNPSKLGYHDKEINAVASTVQLKCPKGMGSCCGESVQLAQGRSHSTFDDHRGINQCRGFRDLLYIPLSYHLDSIRHLCFLTPGFPNLSSVSDMPCKSRQNSINMTMNSIVQGFDTLSVNATTQAPVTDTANMPANNAVASSSVNNTDKAPPTSPIVKPGMISEIKNLYQGKKDDYGNRPWVETYPDDLDDPVENEKTAQFALLIRNKKCHSGRKKLTIASIVVQSPLLKNALKPVFEDYPGITTTLERLEFEPPFAAFVYRWNGFCAAVTNEQDPTVKSHLELLHGVLETEMKDDIKARDDLLAHNVITYDYLWMLFEPGSVVVTAKGGQDQAVLLTSGDYTTVCNCPVYSLTCKNVDWDGSDFGYGSARYNIPAFSGTAPISSLLAFPIMYHSEKDEATERLIARGKVFERLSGYNYKQYQGIAMGDGPWGPIRYNVSLSKLTISQRALLILSVGEQPCYS